MPGTFPMGTATEGPETPNCRGRCRPQNETFPISAVGLSDNEQIGGEFRDKVDAVLAVVFEGGVRSGSRQQENGFGRLADGNDGHGGQRQVQGLLDGIFPEIEDKNPAEAHFRGLEQDALGDKAQVHVHHPVFRNTAANDQEGLYSVSRHWTLDALLKYGLFNGGTYDQRERYAVGARWWPWYTYSGLWVRGLAQTENYARSGVPVFQDGKGQAWGVSLSAGYSLMLLKWLNLDLGAGLWGGRRGLPGAQQDWFAEPEMITVGLMFVF